ncbi:hypothetical protein [Streptomyces sp. NPDC059209]|uniref:hypothetical protein n=1 Tax=Streptomyces sp. NPDC059209 TaxID=3346769 RepID=UPI0036A28421
MNNGEQEPGGVHNNFSNSRAENVFQAQNIGSIYFQSHQGISQQEIDHQFSGKWREDIEGAALSILWDFGLNHNFRARPASKSSMTFMQRLAVKEWSGVWNVSMQDPDNPWIELQATDMESLGHYLVSMIFNQPENKRGSLSRLSRSANITSHSYQSFTLEYLDTAEVPTFCRWTRLA